MALCVRSSLAPWFKNGQQIIDRAHRKLLATYTLLNFQCFLALSSALAPSPQCGPLGIVFDRDGDMPFGILRTPLANLLLNVPTVPSVKNVVSAMIPARAMANISVSGDT